MTNIENAYINALLADASYIDLGQGLLTADPNYSDLENRMTPTLAAYISKNFEVASAINTSDIPIVGSGFDAVVWRGRADGEFAGQVFGQRGQVLPFAPRQELSTLVARPGSTEVACDFSQTGGLHHARFRKNPKRSGHAAPAGRALGAG